MNKYTKKIVLKKNSKIKLFTPGPASLLSENIDTLEPCFGRGDKNYETIENNVLNGILNLTGHKNIARLQGAASMALEIMILNFVYGKILIIKTGVYSDRLNYMCNVAKKNYNYIKKIDYIDTKYYEEIKKNYDWVLACPVETSIGYKMPIKNLYKLKKRCNAKLALDATASIGLEEDHYLSDVAGFSSCKGLFGLTGGAFITFNKKFQNQISEFNLDINNHLNKKMTGPYHAICSLKSVVNSYEKFSYAVKINKEKFLKKMEKYLLYERINQPNLCTLIDRKIRKKNSSVVLYKSRADIKGSVVCHLGEVHLKKKAKGEILKNIELI